MSTNPAWMTKTPVAEIARVLQPCAAECEHLSCEMQKSKPQERDTVRREIDRIARQLEGLSKSLKKLKETA